MLEFLLLISDSSEHDKIIRVYNDYHEGMLKYAVSKFKSMGRRNCVFDAEDTVQNAFVKITRYVHNIDFATGEKSVKNYVFSILNNEICNFLNDNDELDGLDEACSEETAYDFLENIEMKEVYREAVKAIEALDERYSTTLYLFYCKEMRPDKIASLMGLSTKTVYTRIARGTTHLQSSLKELRV